MVNGVTGYNQYASNAAGFYRAAAGTAVLHKNDVENMVKFLNGQPITGTTDPTIAETVKSTLPMIAIFGGISAISPLKKHKWSIKDTVRDINTASPYKSRGQAFEAGKARINAEYGDFLKKKAIANPDRAPLGIGKLLDKIPGYAKLRETGFGKAMGKSGAGWMCIMDGAIETFTQVVPAFQQGGAGAGFSQIAKSGTKVVAGAAGWLAGDAIGKGVGAAIGTVICPGIGTAIGGFIGGFMGGMIGSAVAGKAAKSLTGKNEVEKIQDDQTAQVTQQVEADPNSKIALAQQALTQAEQVLAQDPKNKDALAVKESAVKVLTEAQQTQQEQTAAQNIPQNDMTQAQSVQSFHGSYPGIPPVPGFNGVNYDMNQLLQSQVQAQSSMAYMNQQTNPFAQQQMIPQAY